MKRLLSMALTLALALAFSTTARADCLPDVINPGDLLISEIFPDPTGADTGKEWIEIYNNSVCTKNLKGLIVQWTKPDGTTGTYTIPTTSTATVTKGSQVMLGQYPRKTSADTLGGTLSLRDSTGEIKILKSTTLIDKIDYKNATVGHSIFRPLMWTCIPPDCTQLETGDYGTPGASMPQSYTNTVK